MSDFKSEKEEDDTFCRKCLRNFEQLKLHEGIIHEGIKEQRCLICGTVYLSETRLTDHLLTHGSSISKCFVCDSTFPDWEALAGHLEGHKEVHIYGCELCTLSFATRQAYRDHRDRDHPPDPRKRCFTCDFVFSTIGRLKFHLARAHPNDYKCSLCGKYLCSARQLRFHMWKHTKERPFPCTKCELRFPTSARLKEHVEKTHLGVSNYFCPICDLKFKYPHSYRAHMVLHDKGDLFECAECGKRFRYKLSLREHLSTGVACEACGDQSPTFPCRTALADHQATQHTSFDCPHCDKASFNIERALKRHITMNHFDKVRESVKNTFGCALCGQFFNTKHNLSRHKRRNHR